jgi:uncharacterized protein YggU (UPF0235/DUF167 family)
LTFHADLAAPAAEPAGHAHPNQFALLAQRRFAPFFWTQFLGAGNDNLFKFAFTVLITYQLQVHWLPASLAGLVIGALFILPFLLFSATSGQLADKFDKALLMRFVKWLEIAVMAPPVEGAANDEVRELVARTFGVAKGRVAIVTGESGRSKVVEVTGLSAAEAEAKLEALSSKNAR